MGTHEPADQVRSVLAEVTELLWRPNPRDLERALLLLDNAKGLLRGLWTPEGDNLPDLQRTLNDLLRLAEQTAAFYLGLAAAIISHAGGYSSDGEAALPADCRQLSVEG